MSAILTEPLPAVGVISPVLSDLEKAALLECEAIIRQGRAVFVQVGQALSRIRDSRLYREKYSTFEEYCLEEWEISDRFSRNLRSAADVVRVLQEKNFTVLPATESQARPLTKLPREEWAPAWLDAIGTAPNGKITASHVTGVVQERINRASGVLLDGDEENPKPARADSRPTVVEAGSRGERVRASLNQARAALRELSDLIGTPDGAEAANLRPAIRNLDDLQDYLVRKETMLSNRQQKQTEGTEI